MISNTIKPMKSDNNEHLSIFGWITISKGRRDHQNQCLVLDIDYVVLVHAVHLNLKNNQFKISFFSLK